ncbi:DUF410-domain-containing protein [Piromyces finnis]|uniref:DUF410-domain-containing protein n=1 Tax=Piromyces finnis TaxID=1754191 RepID=A0A1Y1V7G8_9FUNG|nr:DUF410-domain-containing protein [Piromyces finnis]|eukprot:ORX48970.1 DUF410-domain-containing protein [Piromyces finnis]
MISTNSFSKVSRGTQKNLNNINASIKEGKYYEAHQMLHSVSQRYVKQRKINDAIHLLHNGAKSLLNYDQEGSAYDLFKRLINIYNNESVMVTEESVGRLIDILNSFKSINNFTEDAMKLSIAWSIKFGNTQFGDQSIHHAYGLKCLKEKKFYNAEMHFVFGNLDSAKALGIMDYQWSTEGYTSDYGHFIARAILQYLAIKKLSNARTCLSSFCEKIKANKPDCIIHNTNNVDLYSSSLLNYCQVLILIIERENTIEQYQQLNQKYEETLYKADPFLTELVEHISEIFFNIRKQKPHNMFEDLINSFFGPAPSNNALTSENNALD